MKKRNAKVFALFMSVAMAMPNVAAAMPVYAAPEADFGDKFEEEFEAEAEEEVEAEDITDADDEFEEEFVEETEDIEVVEGKKDDDNTPIVKQGTCGKTNASNVQWELRQSGVLYLTADTEDEMYTRPDGGYDWEDKKDLIKEVYVDGPLTNISSFAFKDCENLQLVTLNKHIIDIEESAFENCTALERVTYPSSDKAMVENYGAAAFRNCTALTYLTFTKELTTIDEFCFYNCKSLSFPNGLNLQGKIQYIQRGAFWGCTSLTKLILPANIRAVLGDHDGTLGDADAVSNTTDLEGKWGAFAGCTGLTSIEFKSNNNEGIGYIGEFAFYGCTGLGTLSLPSTLSSIDKFAFEDCTGLTTVSMDDSDVDALYGTFKRCRGLSSFTVNPTYHEATDTYTGNLYVIDKETFQSCTSLKTVDLAPKADHGPAGDQDYIIGESAFRDCTSLDSIILPWDLYSLGDRSFQGCTALTTIDVPEGTETIGKNTFFNDIKLDDIYLPSTLVSIGDNAFSCQDNALETMRLMDVYYGGGDGAWSADAHVVVEAGDDGAWDALIDPANTGANNTLLTASGKNYRYKANKYVNANIDLQIPQIKEVVYNNGGMTISWDKVSEIVNDKEVSPSYYHIYQNHDKDNTITEQWKMQTPLWEEVAVVSGSEDEFTYNIQDVMKAGDVYSFRIQAVYDDITGDYVVDCSKLGDAVTYTIPVNDDDIIPVDSLTFEESSISLKIGDSKDVPLVITPVDATSVNYAWKSEDPSVAVATVSDDKKSVTITAKKAGHTMISVSTPDGAKTASFIVYVVDPKATQVEKITVDSKNVTVQADESVSTKVSITITPEDAVGGFVWESENPTVASVKVADDEKSAQITGLKVGDTKITVTSNNGIKATINVKVTEKEVVPQGSTPIVVEDTDGKTTVYKDGKAVEDYTGLARLGTAEDAPFVYVENGERNLEFEGYVSYDGGKFYVKNGVLDTKTNGVQADWTTNPVVFYFCANGQVQTQHVGLAAYNGEWFYVENGKVATDMNAFVKYDGGLFAVGAGRIISEYNGLMQDPQNTTTGDWYFFSGGQAQTQYTGLALYNGHWFYVQSGKFDPAYNGTVVYDGATFNVVNGEAQVK